LKIVLIGNPIAGTGKAKKQIERFAQKLTQRGHLVEIFLTSAAGDALNHAKFVDASVDRIVVAGGDGTVNEVLNGLQDPSQVPILHLAGGTANMLAYDLSLPQDLDTLVDLVEQGSVRKVDLGLVNGRRFLLLVTVGIDAAVVREMEMQRAAGMGFANYIAPVLSALRNHEPRKLFVTIDDHEMLQGEHVMVLKCRNYGRFFSFTEQARLDAGFLEVVVFSNATVAAIAQTIFAGLVGKPEYLPDVIRRRCTRVNVDSSDPVPVEADGDYIGTTPIQIEMLPSMIPLLVPGRTIK
jgi:diacylglycerol kinase (ATP)